MLHKGQLLWVEMSLFFNVSKVGRLSCISLHTKLQILIGTLILQICFQTPFWMCTGLDWFWEEVQESSTSNVYTVLTLKSPIIEYFHRSLSLIEPVLDNGMFIISNHWRYGYKARTRSSFQVLVLWSIRSATVPMKSLEMFRFCEELLNQSWWFREIL